MANRKYFAGWRTDPHTRQLFINKGGVNVAEITTSGVSVPNLTASTTVTASIMTTTALNASGVVKFTGLPTSDPSVAGQLWSNSGVLTVSAG